MGRSVASREPRPAAWITVTLLTLFVAWASPIVSAGQGLYFSKKRYEPRPLPAFATVRDKLPSPIFEEDPDTEAVVLIGEIGGREEEEAAEFIADDFNKPVVAFVSGRTAPQGRRMGHAGAIIAGGQGTADEKVKALREAGVTVVDSPALIGETAAKMFKRDA